MKPKICNNIKASIICLFITLNWSTPIYPNYIEDFNDGLAQNWNADVEADWSVVGGVYRAYTNASNSEVMVSTYGGSISSDFIFQVDARSTQTLNPVGIIFRATGDFDSDQSGSGGRYRGSGYMFLIHYAWDEEEFPTIYSVIKIVNGVETTLRSWTYSPYINYISNGNNLSATIQGNHIECWANGYLLDSFDDASLSTGRIGLCVFTDYIIKPTGYFDNIVVSFSGPVQPTLTPTPVTSPTPLSPVIDSGDYDGDNTSDIGIFRASSGLWALRGVTRVYFGSSSDIPVTGDYDGDGTSDIGIFRRTSGLWAVRGITRTYYGSSSDTPVPLQFNPSSACSIGIFRETSGLWAVKGVTRLYFGTTGDIPVPGDYDGDSTKEIGIFRGTSGLWAIRGVSRVYFGGSSDEPVPRDYTGDDTCDIGIFRGSSGLWAIRSVTRSYFGGSTDEPVPADYNGDSMDDIGIFRDSSGLWAIRGISRVYFGGSGDIPVTR